MLRKVEVSLVTSQEAADLVYVTKVDWSECERPFKTLLPIGAAMLEVDDWAHGITGKLRWVMGQYSCWRTVRRKPTVVNSRPECS